MVIGLRVKTPLLPSRSKSCGFGFTKCIEALKISTPSIIDGMENRSKQVKEEEVEGKPANSLLIALPSINVKGTATLKVS